MTFTYRNVRCHHMLGASYLGRLFRPQQAPFRKPHPLQTLVRDQQLDRAVVPVSVNPPLGSSNSLTDNLVK